MLSFFVCRLRGSLFESTHPCSLSKIRVETHWTMATKFEEEVTSSAAPLTKEGNTMGKTREKEDGEIRHILTGEAYSDHHEIILFKVMNPMYICLQIFGLLWTNKSNMFRQKRCTFDLSTFHCCLVLFLAWSNVVRYAARYDRNEKYLSDLLTKVCCHVFDIQFACGITASVYFMHKHVPNFIKLWENYKIKHGGVSFAVMKRNIIIRMVSANVAAFVVIIGPFIVGLFKEPDLYATHHLPLLGRLRVTTPLWLTILITFLYAYIGFAWLQSLFFCICLNKNLREELLQLSSQFCEEIDGIKRMPSLKLKTSAAYKTQYTSLKVNVNHTEHYRQRYLEICTLVSTYDDIISSYLLSVYFFSLPIIVLLVYLLLGFGDAGVYKQNAMFWSWLIAVVYYIMYMIIVTMSSSALSNAVSIAISLFNFDD